MSRRPSPTLAAITAADAIQKLNGITLDQRLSAPLISATMQALTRLVDQLPQTFEQLAYQLEQRQAEGDIRMDTDEDPAQVVPEVLARFAEAGAMCEPAGYREFRSPGGPLSSAVHAAASPLFHMTAK